MEKQIIVVGGGPGGYVAAIRAAQLGAKVTLIEKKTLGGTCLNIGCIPTKCLLHSAELMEQMNTQAAELGIRAENVGVDFPQVIAHKNAVSERLTGGIATLLKANKVAVIYGEASFKDEKTLLVTTADGEQELTADDIILSLGSVNAIPPIPGLKENPCCIDSTGALSLSELPKSMAVIGGGVIGLELASAYAAFGTAVTVIEALPTMLPMLDADIVNLGVRHMKKLGVQFYTECPVQRVEPCEAGARVICTDKKGQEVVVEAEKVLVAAGRRANTASVCPEKAGLALERGAIPVNDKMETNVPHIYAVGDCVKGYAQLAHTASAMGEVAAENICGEESRYNETTNPTCVYIFPEAAAVGLTERAAKERGVDYKVGKFLLGANGKSLILNGGEGSVKLLADPASGRLLGMQMIGPRATDLIAEGALAIKMGATVEDLIETIHSHPTVSEAVREAALSLEKRAIHAKN